MGIMTADFQWFAGPSATIDPRARAESTSLRHAHAPVATSAEVVEPARVSEPVEAARVPTGLQAAAARHAWSPVLDADAETYDPNQYVPAHRAKIVERPGAARARSWLLEGPVVVAEEVPRPVPSPAQAPRPPSQRSAESRARPSAGPRISNRGYAAAAGRLGILFVAGAMPVLAIPLQVFGVLPLEVSARVLVIPLACIVTVIMLGSSAQGAWAARALVAGLVAVTRTTRCASR
jgi:hypothetical protein